MATMAAFNEVKTGGLASHEASILAKSGNASLFEAMPIACARGFAILGLPRPLGLSLVLWQVALNTTLGLVLLGYWRQFGASYYWGLLGFSAVAWGLTQMVFPEGLPIATTGDLILLVACAWAVSAQRPVWGIPLALLSLMNGNPLGFLLAVFLYAGGILSGDTSGCNEKTESLFDFFRRPWVWLTGVLIYAAGLFAIFPAREAWNLLGGVWGITPWLAIAAVPRCSKRFLITGGALLIFWGFCVVQDTTRPEMLYVLLPPLLLFLPIVLVALSKAHNNSSQLETAEAPTGHRAPFDASLFVVTCAAFLSAWAVWHQISIMDSQGGLAWYEKVQWERTCQVMHGEQGTPWQYRLFTDSIVYGTVRTFETLGIPRPIGTAFVLIRLLQNTLMGCLVVAFYRRLGIPALASLLGLGLLTWGMAHGLYDTDMTFNTYTDMSLFLIAGIIIFDKKFQWLLPLMLIASLNRETSGCIPFMFLFSQWRPGERPSISRKTWFLFAAALLLWFSIVGGLRLVYGVRPYIVPTAGKSPILPLLWFNLTWWRTWVFLLATLGIIPFLGLASWKAWPDQLRRYWWAVVPVWFPAHFCLAHAPETRLFLVPQVLIFLPAALIGGAYWCGASAHDFSSIRRYNEHPGEENR